MPFVISTSGTVVMEAGCGYQLWFWHCAFGYVGTMNDINILDSSKLHQSLHGGSFEKNDFAFEVGGGKYSTNYGFLLMGYTQNCLAL